MEFHKRGLLHGTRSAYILGNTNAFKHFLNSRREILYVCPILIATEAKPVSSAIGAYPDKRSRCQSIGFCLDLLEQQDGPIRKYDARLWHGMVAHVTAFSKEDILFTMKDGTEIRV